MKVKDITNGMKVGKLTVISRDPDKMCHPKSAYYLCQCECGNIISTTAHNIGKGNGCANCFRGQSLLGMKFGKLTVLEYSENRKTTPRAKYKSAFWKVRCDCGNELEAYSSQLRAGYIKQCHECRKRTGATHSGPGGYTYVIVARGDEYKYVTRPHKFAPYKIFQHIVVMAEYLGRPIDTTKESIHHKNGDKTDNRIENLELKALYHGKGHSHFEMIVSNIKYLSPAERRIVKDLLA